MNERIKELAEQAGWSGFEALDERNQKFAQLIVRECARVAMNTDLEDVEGGDSDVLYAAHTQIKQHFGVKYERNT